MGKNLFIKLSEMLLMVFLIVFFFPSCFVSQQTNLYMPIEVQKAISNQTRSEDGKPGPKYWQNNTEYKINVSIDPSARLLKGNESIVYYNNSPDSLRKIVIRLYQDMNKIGEQRDFNLQPESITEGVKILNLSINDSSVNLENKSQANLYETNLSVYLREKLAPKNSLSINVNWEFTIPKGQNPRMGIYGDSSFFIGYWYPQIAVYDDVYGWDEINYTGQAEFYNDFSDFDVNITVPGGFTVWSTGVLQNKEDIFTEEYLKRYNEALNSDKIVHIITEQDLNKPVYKSKDENTWHFTAEHVPDFAFALSNKYLWDGVSTIVDKKEERKVFISAAFDPASRDFYEVDAISKFTIESLSNDFPGVPFPYPSLTVFNGSGGMEYPMMVNDGSYNDRASTIHVTSHEISHTYFPFYMGINERKYAWMDEGWATMIPSGIQNELDSDYKPIERNAAYYERVAGTDMDVPLIIPSFLLNGNAYRNASYSRPGSAYYILRDALGKDVFDKALKDYIKIWHGKHPLPYDFFNSFNESTGEDLSWFWNPWFLHYAYPDLAIAKAEVKGDSLKVLVKNIGNLPLPIAINIVNDKGEITSSYETAKIWSTGKTEIWVRVKIQGKVSLITLDDPKIPDINKENNLLHLGKSSTL